jgi:transporter family-2 protein
MTLSSILGILVAILAGTLIGTQAPLTSFLRQKLGLWGMAVGVHVAGLVAALLILLTVERQADRAWADWWWLAIVTGVAGLGILVTLSVAVGELGAATALGISIAVQLSVTAAIDHFGWLGVEIQPLSWTRALGILLLIAGARLVVGRG